jgi:tetratricopeptide (TPR) repeat protein
MMKKILISLAILVVILPLACGQKGSQLSSGSKRALAEYELGIIASDKMYFQEAAGHFQRAVELDPEFAEAYSRLSRVAWQMGNESTAKKFQMKALGLMNDESGKDRVTERERLIIVLHDAYLHDDYEQAHDVLNRMVEKFPEDREMHIFMGIEHMRMESYDDAILSYERAAELDPNYAQTYNSLGYLYLSKGDLDRARENLEKYKKLASDQANPYDSIGELEQARGNYKDALKYYLKALDVNPDLRFVLHHLGEVHEVQGRYVEAIEYYRQAAEKAIGPEAEAFSRQYLAYSYLRKGDPKQALTEAKRAAELSPRDPSSHFYLGLVSLAMGDLASAEMAARKVNDWIERRNLRQYGTDRLFYHLTGQIQLAKKEYQSAVDSHRQAVDLTPNPLYRNFYVHALGIAYLKAGRLEEALASLQMALRQNPHHADCLSAMVFVYKELGDKKLAKEYMNRFREVVKDADRGVPWIRAVEGLKL